MPDLDQYLEDNAQAFEDDLCELLRIPSVSADSTHKADVRRAAQWVAGQFQGLGLATEICETPGHPIVYAESPAVPGAPTVLVYGHYDVQPPDPLGLWISPPFEPTAATAISMLVEPPTTRGKCSRTSKAPRPG